MSEWKQYKLGDIADLFDGPHATPKKTTAGPVFLGISSLNKGKLEVSQFEYISEADFVRWTKRVVPQQGDIVFSYETKLGEAAIIPAGIQCCLGRRLGMLRAKNDKVDSHFLLYYYLGPIFQSVIHERTIHGTTVDRLPLIDMPKFPILLPPLPEQKAIAAVLSSLDDKIELLHRQNKTLEDMAETLFRQWFVEEADEGWKEGKVLDYCTHHKVGIKPQEYVSRSYSHYSIPAFDNGKTPVVENGSEIQSNKYTVVPNCLLFSKLNPNKEKRIWLILDNLGENPICSTEFQVILPRSRKYLFFLYSWLSIPLNYNEIASGVGGTSGSHQRIDPADIFTFPCPLIEDSYINSFNLMAEPIFMKMNNNRIQILTLENLRDTLLPKLISGEVRVAL